MPWNNPSEHPENVLIVNKNMIGQLLGRILGTENAGEKGGHKPDVVETTWKIHRWGKWASLEPHID